MVQGKPALLERDVSETDRFGRLLRYVWVDGVLINAELVREGWAQSSSYPPDVRYQACFRQLEREAREAGRGIWAPAAPTAQPGLPVGPR
jgi:micrococcal nuclease